MSLDSEALVAKWWGELWTKGDLTVADEICHPDFRDSDPNSPWVEPGIAGIRDKVSGYRAAFPDLTIVPETVLSCPGHVVSYWKAWGTHTGEALGLAPTGGTFEIVGISIMRMNGEKIVEHIVNWDGLGLQRQLGLLP